MSANEDKYNLKERTYFFTKDIRSFVKKIPITIANMEDGKQLIRSSGSVGGLIILKLIII